MLKSGIYKITSPTDKIYIGRAVHINRRFASYRRMSCKNQPLLYLSFLKHGVSTHSFEVIEYCEIERLNERERHYISVFKCTHRGIGLNCTSGGDSCVFTAKTKRKMSKSATGRVSPMKGRKQSEEAKLKMSVAKKGKPNWAKGIKKTDAQKQKCRLARLGIPHSEETKAKMSADRKGMNGKAVIDTKNGNLFISATEAAKSIGMKDSTLSAMLRGENKNKTTFKYLT